MTETCDDAPPCDCAHFPDDGSEPGAGSDGHAAGCASQGFPNLITCAETTAATVPDGQMTTVIDDTLAGKNLAPARHYTGSGYLSAELAVSELTRHGIALIGPLLADTSPQARAGKGYARADFAIDYDAETVTCPQGKTAASWNPCTQRGKDAIVVCFSAADCGPCPARTCAPKADAGSSRCRPATSRKPRQPPAPRRKRPASRLITPAAPVWRAPCTRPPATARGAPATEGWRKPGSTTCIWPAPSTSCGSKRIGTAPRSTGDGLATSHASNSTSPRDREINQQDHRPAG